MHPRTRAERRFQKERVIANRMAEVAYVYYQDTHDWEYKWDIYPGLAHKNHFISKHRSRWDDYRINRKILRKLLSQFPDYPYKVRRKYTRKMMREKY